MNRPQGASGGLSVAMVLGLHGRREQDRADMLDGIECYGHPRQVISGAGIRRGACPSNAVVDRVAG